MRGVSASRAPVRSSEERIDDMRVVVVAQLVGTVRRSVSAAAMASRAMSRPKVSELDDAGGSSSLRELVRREHVAVVDGELASLVGD